MLLTLLVWILEIAQPRGWNTWFVFEEAPPLGQSSLWKDIQGSDYQKFSSTKGLECVPGELSTVMGLHCVHCKFQVTPLYISYTSFRIMKCFSITHAIFMTILVWSILFEVKVHVDHCFFLRWGEVGQFPK